MNQEIIDAYESRLIRRGQNECWGWSGGKHEHGYGQVIVANKVQRAHRISYEVVNGKIPAGLDVMHKCHNPECSNPLHLVAGTRRQNMHDSMKAGRLQRKIPLSDMPKIFEWKASGWTLQQIANVYACSKQAVRHMMRAHPELQHA